MIQNLHTSRAENVAACLGVIERGLRRLGIDPYAVAVRAAGRTIRNGQTGQQVLPANRRRNVRGILELSEHQIARIVALHDAGKVQSEIAREIGCSQSTVAKRLAAAGRRTFQPRRRLAA